MFKEDLILRFSQITVLLLSSFIHADTIDAPITKLKVETLFFTQPSALDNKEFYSPAISLHYPEKTLPLGTENQFEPAAMEQLQQAHNALMRNASYRVLLAQSWLQPITNSHYFIEIAGGRTIDGVHEIAGTLRIIESEKPVVEANLWFVEFKTGSTSLNTQLQNKAKTLWPIPPISPLPSELLGEQNLAFPIEVTHLFSPEINSISTLKKNQRMRLNKTYYLDHPKFGMLIQVHLKTVTTPSSNEENHPPIERKHDSTAS